MSTQKFYIVTELSRTDCGYEYIEYFDTEAEAQAFIDEHQAEYGGTLAIVESQR